MTSLLERVTIFCFAASYGVALALELWHLVRPRPILRLVSLTFGVAGLCAHTVYVMVQYVGLRTLTLASPLGSLLFLAWILAVFYLYGSLHHRRLAWGLFVLPIVLGLIVLGTLFPSEAPRDENGTSWSSYHSWGVLHGVLLLLAAVGVCVSFIASLMYLVQVRRLKTKAPPGQGMKMLSLERIEAMNRRGVLWAFPLLTAGLLTGILLQLERGTFFQGWDSPKIISGLGLWLVFAILLYLRYGIHVRGRQMALWTTVAFVLLVLALVSPVHSFPPGDGP